jgi:hypothetical protein
MKVYVGTMYRIIVERKCGCRAAQEFKDEFMKEPDGEPTYKPCAKHQRGHMKEIIQEFMFEVLENKAEEHRSQANIAIAEANASRVTEAPVGEGATAETHAPIKIAGVTKKPAVVTAAPSGNVPNQPRPNPVVRKANLAAGSRSGLRRATVPARASEVIAAKQAAVPEAGPVEAGDIQMEPVEEDPRVTKILVDDPDGGLLGAHEDESIA